MGIGTFIVNRPDFGWQAFGGNVISTSPSIQVQIHDSVHCHVYIAPLETLLSIDAGAFSSISYDPPARTVSVTITAAPDGLTGAATTPNGRLVIEQKATLSGITLLKPMTNLVFNAGAYIVPFTSGSGTLTLAM